MRIQVVQYLIDHYGLTEIQAINFVTKHESIIESAAIWHSHPYYPARKIAVAEHLEHLDPCHTCKLEVQ